MSASDDIKVALVAAYPSTREKDWKRTSKKVVDGVEVRTFANAPAGLEVTVRDGVIEGAPPAPVIRAYDPDLAAKVTETAQATLSEMLAEPAVTAVTQPDTGAVFDPKPGDMVLIPAGTATLTFSGWEERGQNAMPATVQMSKRDSTVEIVGVFSLNIEKSLREWSYHYLTDEERNAAFKEGTASPPSPFSIVRPETAYERSLRTKALVKLPLLGDGRFVIWGNGRAAPLVKCQPAAADAKPKANPGVKAPSKKDLMKEKSVWRVNKDVAISILWDNPVYDAEVKAVHARFPRGGWGGAMNEITSPPRVPTPSIDLKEGTLLTVIGKKLIPDSFGGDTNNGYSNGHGVKFGLEPGENIVHNLGTGFDYYGWQGKKVGDKIEIILPYKIIEPHVDAVSVDEEQAIFVIRDSASGLYYKMPNHGAKQYVTDPRWDAWIAKRDSLIGDRTPEQKRKLQDWIAANPCPVGGEGQDPRGHYVLRNGVEHFEMVEKVSKAKQFTDLGKLKTNILNFTGYYQGLDTNMAEDDYMPEYVSYARGEGNDVGYPLPKTFVVEKLNKFSKAVIETIDIQDWYARTLRLRVLTKKFGSTVRNVYQKLEKGGKLAEVGYIVTMSTTKGSGLTAEKASEIEGSIKNLGIGKVAQAKDKVGLTVAVSDFGQAFALKASFDDLEVAVLDAGSLAEAVEQGQA